MHLLRPLSLLQIFSTLLISGAFFLFAAMGVNAYFLGQRTYDEALKSSFLQKRNLAQQTINNELERFARTTSYWAGKAELAGLIETKSWDTITTLVSEMGHHDELLTLDLFYITNLKNEIQSDQSSPFYLSKLLFRHIIEQQGKSESFVFQEENGPQQVLFRKENIIHPRTKEVVGYFYAGIVVNHWLEIIGNITTITQSAGAALYTTSSAKTPSTQIISTLPNKKDLTVINDQSRFKEQIVREDNFALNISQVQLGRNSPALLVLVEDATEFAHLQRRYIISAGAWFISILVFTILLIWALHRLLNQSLAQLLAMTQHHGKAKEVITFLPTAIREFNIIGKTIEEMIKTLRQNENIFKTIFDYSKQFKGLLASDGSLITANAHALEHQKLKLHDIKGKKFWSTPWFSHSPELQKKIRDAVEKATMGEASQFEVSHLSPVHGLTQVLFSLNPVKDDSGKTIFMIPEGLDITSLKQAESILSQHNQQLEHEVSERTKELTMTIEQLQQTNRQVALVTSAVESSNEAVAIINFQGEILYYNNAFARQFQSSEKKIISIFEVFAERSHFINRIKQLAEGKPWIEKISIKSQKGTNQDLLLNANLVTKSSEEQLTIVVAFTDLTTHVQTEEKLHQAEIDRHIAINANRAKSSFLANMSHELRTPLHCISSFTSLAHKKLLINEYGKINNYLETVTECTHELSDLIDQLLLLSSLEAGLIHYTKRQYSIDVLISEVEKHFKKKLEQKKIQVRYHSNNPAIRAYFDSHHLVHVFHGLMANAVKYASPETTIEVNVDDYWENENLYTIVSFKNTGLPIPHDELQIIFSDFHHKLAEKNTAGGTGLGLSICRRIIEDHQGKIWATSSPEGVTEICLTLPKGLEE